MTFVAIGALRVKILFAYYVRCIYSNAIKNTFVMEANTMNVDQTAGAV